MSEQLLLLKYSFDTFFKNLYTVSNENTQPEDRYEQIEDSHRQTQRL